MTNDSVADVLIRIKNGYLVLKKEVTIPYSKLVFNFCKLLEQEGYVETVEKKERELSVVLKYHGRSPALSGVQRVSKPGLRVYKGVKQLPRVLNGLGVAVISTPQGLMTDKEARKKSVGGEIMAFIW